MERKSPYKGVPEQGEKGGHLWDAGGQISAENLLEEIPASVAQGRRGQTKGEGQHWRKRRGVYRDAQGEELASSGLEKESRGGVLGTVQLRGKGEVKDNSEQKQ